MRRRIVVLFLAAVMAMSVGVTARADVLWEPENRFYEKHSQECEHLGRGFYANGPEGFVTLWDAPNGSRVQGQLTNGGELWVDWHYQDWAYASVYDGGEATEGWVPLAELQLIYDYISFAQDYAGEIREYAGEFADYSGDAEGVAFYEYPGAPAVKTYWTVEQNDELMTNLTGGPEGESYIQSVFVDEQGLTWGFVGYMYGRMNAWFCLDDPAGDGEQGDGESVFPLRQVGTPELIPPQDPVAQASAYIPWLLVGAVVVVTAVLLGLFIRRGRKKRDA